MAFDLEEMFYTREELKNMNFKSLGENVLIDRLTQIYKPEKISLGNNVRIGSYCILSGDINIGNYVHIASYSFLNGNSGIDIGDFVGIASYARVITESSDFSGESIAVPTVDISYRKDIKKKIYLKNHSLLGTGSVILPGGNLEEGVAVGAMSMICRPTKAFGIYFGIPAKRIQERSRNMVKLEQDVLKGEKNAREN